MTMKLRAVKLKAAFLMAVAAVLILMPAPGDAQAHEQDTVPVTLSGLTITNAAASGDSGFGKPAYFANSFRPDEDGYLVNVHKSVTSVTVTPTAPSLPASTIKVKLGDMGTPQAVASGEATTAITLTPNDDLSTPHKIYVTVTEAEHSDNTKTYTISVYQFDDVAFPTVTVALRVYTAGAPAPNDAGPLPAINKHDFLEVSHSASGLPAGLHLVDGRRRAFIGGTPTAATNGPVDVYLYTTAPELGSTATLYFQVEVKSAPVFTADPDVFATYHGDYKEFKRSQFRYTIGQTDALSVTLPAATGGTGTLTYQLLPGVGKDSVAPASVDKINFDSATRELSIGVGADAPTVAGSYGVRWVVTDENGASATIYGSLVVANAPTLPEITDKTYTVGDEVAFELPKGSSEHGEYSLNYEVTPELSRWAYWPDLYWEGYKLTGTAKYKGEIPITYTVTDPNGVSASETFTVTISSGTNAPQSAPASLTVDVEAREQEGKVIGTAKLEWDTLPNAADATGCPTGTFVSGPHVDGCTYYVVQVRDSSGSFPGRIRLCPDDMARTHSGPGMRAKKRSSTSVHWIPAPTRPGSPGRTSTERAHGRQRSLSPCRRSHLEGCSQCVVLKQQPPLLQPAHTPVGESTCTGR